MITEKDDSVVYSCSQCCCEGFFFFNYLIILEIYKAKIRMRLLSTIHELMIQSGYLHFSCYLMRDLSSSVDDMTVICCLSYLSSLFILALFFHRLFWVYISKLQHLENKLIKCNPKISLSKKRWEYIRSALPEAQIADIPSLKMNSLICYPGAYVRELFVGESLTNFAVCLLGH